MDSFSRAADGKRKIVMKQFLRAFLTLSLVYCGSLAMAAEKETIAIIGTGDLGDSFGIRLAELGYPVIYGSRTPQSDRVIAVVERTGHGATATTQHAAAERGDIVILPINWPAMESAINGLGALSGKIVIDPSDPWTQGKDGYPESMLETSSAELIQQWKPDAKVVKAFGTMGSGVIDDPRMAGGPVTIPIASDHRDAKERVARLATELGFDPVDFGPVRMARLVEALGLIYMIPLLQDREEEWEFYFRRNSDWVCRFRDEWADPVFDADNLADMSDQIDPENPCR